MSKVPQTTLKNIVMMTKNVGRTSDLFTELIGLKLIHQTNKFAELRDSRDFRIIIR